MKYNDNIIECVQFCFDEGGKRQKRRIVKNIINSKTRGGYQLRKNISKCVRIDLLHLEYLATIFSLILTM